MRKVWVVVLVFIGFAVIAAGCSRKDDHGYVPDPYGEATGATPKGGGMPAPAATDATGAAAGAGGIASGNPMAPGWAPRKYAGDPLAGTGSDLSKAEHEKMKQIGQDYNRARKMYQDYFTAKEAGKEDRGTLQSAIALYEQLLTQLEAMQESHPNDKSVEEYFSNVSQERRNLLLEQ